jgi:hypothetical protein
MITTMIKESPVGKEVQSEKIYTPVPVSKMFNRCLTGQNVTDYYSYLCCSHELGSSA